MLVLFKILRFLWHYAYQITTLHSRNINSRNFSIQIECINIRHTRNIIEHGHYFVVIIGAVCFELFGNAVKQLFGIRFFGMQNCFDKMLQQGADNFVTCQFDIQHYRQTANDGCHSRNAGRRFQKLQHQPLTGQGQKPRRRGHAD